MKLLSKFKAFMSQDVWQDTVHPIMVMGALIAYMMIYLPLFFVSVIVVVILTVPKAIGYVCGRCAQGILSALGFFIEKPLDWAKCEVNRYNLLDADYMTESLLAEREEPKWLDIASVKGKLP